MCIYTHVLPPLPEGGMTLCLQHSQGVVCDITPSSHLCNSTDIKVQHIALRREDTHQRQEAIADGGAPAPTFSVNRENLLLLSCVERRTAPPSPPAGGSEAWRIKG